MKITFEEKRELELTLARIKQVVRLLASQHPDVADYLRRDGRRLKKLLGVAEMVEPAPPPVPEKPKRKSPHELKHLKNQRVREQFMEASKTAG